VAISGAKEFGAAGDGGGFADGGKGDAAQHSKGARPDHHGQAVGVHGRKGVGEGVPEQRFAIEAPTLNHAEAPYELVKTMRASILTLGP